MSDYQDFLRSKSQANAMDGFAPTFMPDGLFPFQAALTEWAIRKGRALLAEDCGLGKTFQELVFAENCVRETNRPSIILTPLAVAPQTVRVAEKFGIEAAVRRSGYDLQHRSVHNLSACCISLMSRVSVFISATIQS